MDCRNFKTDSPIDLAESYSIFSQIVKGVEFIHSKAIVHHDIKVSVASAIRNFVVKVRVKLSRFQPNNIFIGEDGNDVQVGDFGLSCCLLHNACPDTPAVNIFSSPNCPVSYTREGEIGTRLYAAPEQLNRICDSKVRVDD